MTRKEFELALDAIVYGLIEEYHGTWNSSINDIIGQRWQKPLPEEADRSEYWSQSEKNKLPKINALLNQWVTSGVEGGNCWNSRSNHFTNSEPKPQFTLLIMILEKMAPNLLFTQWNDFQKNYIKQGEWTKHEYYGNHENISFEWIELDDLYEFLNSRNLLTSIQSNLDGSEEIEQESKRKP